MLSIEETIKKINNDKLEEENNRKTRQNKSRETELMLEFFAKSFEEFIKQIASGKYSVDVKFPDIQKIRGDVSVEGLSALLHSMDELKVATKGNKLTLPETQKISGEVTVKNPTPKTEIPEYPKQIKSDITSLPKYVGEKLDQIKKELSKIEVRPEVNVETKASDVVIDLKDVKDRLESVVEAIKGIEIPENKVDFSDLEKSVKATTKAINNLVFPIPNSKAAFEKGGVSYSMDIENDELPVDVGKLNMAVSGYSADITTTAQEIAFSGGDITIPANTKGIIIQNDDADNIIYLGGSNVTSAGANAGHALNNQGDSVSFNNIDSSFTVYVVGSAAGTQLRITYM